ncbi:hypothetical protein LMG19083_03928 [Ralstonia psammae]|uniref:Type VI secretion system-associated protein TagF n=1 Tax=Ralstonia psammae TaxID=3058598 RepID=A0ABM9JTD1_9RALS|nr:type VI secretion system-associated protein TagF [Ralstonia sp. LMG 19083]CAJ0803689.1 hypothetical protein LMG19083_03928 [Ralstonia sp. LMG 19083]
MISAPSIFGKLPALGDYVRHNAPLEQVEAWRAWFDAADAESSRRQSPPPHHAHQYKYGRATFLLLSARELVFPGDGYVVGVAMPSHDRVGRRYPLVVWQSATGYWAEQLLEAPATWLTNLARTMYEHVHLREKQNLAAAVDALWAWHRPYWRSRYGIRFTQNIGSHYAGTLLSPRLTRPLVRHDWPEPRLQRGSGGCLWQVDCVCASQVASASELMRLIAEL